MISKHQSFLGMEGGKYQYSVPTVYRPRVGAFSWSVVLIQPFGFVFRSKGPRVVNSVADPDPGSGAFFFDPGSGKSFLRIPDPKPIFLLA